MHGSCFACDTRSKIMRKSKYPLKLTARRGREARLGRDWVLAKLKSKLWDTSTSTFTGTHTLIVQSTPQ